MFVGRYVVFVSLRNQDMNGVRGIVTAVDPESKRFIVDCGPGVGSGKLLKADNLALVTFAHKPNLLKVFDELIRTFAAENAKFNDIARNIKKAFESDDAHDLEICNSIMELVQMRMQLGSHRVFLACWIAMTKILPILRDITGSHSLQVAGVLLILINTYEELKPGPSHQGKYTALCIKFADDLAVVAATGTMLNHGGAFACPLPYWGASLESVKPMDLFYLQAEASNHKGSAHQNRGEFDTAETLYREAIDVAETNGHRELASGFYANLGTLHQHLACPAFFEAAHGSNASAQRPGQRRVKQGGAGGGGSGLTKNPDVFDEKQTSRLNEALRCCLKRLRISEEIHGAVHVSTAAAHAMLADLCYTCRVRKPCVFHAEQARLIYVSVCGPQHQEVVRMNQMHHMYTTSYAIATPVTLDLDVQEGLAKRALGTKCDHDGCLSRETEELKFRKCSRCLMAKYCSPACQKAAWSDHKKYCKKAEAFAAEQSSDAYKAEQKRLKATEKDIQKKLAAAVPTKK